jgi:fatty acid amide hydrolase
MRCAPLGIGSDIGGSLRFPPSFCGVVGLKPGTTRLSSKGHTKYEPEFDGQFGIPATIGPIAKSVEDCAVFMRAFLNNNKYYEELKSSERDLYYRPQPFNEDLYKSTKKLRIGFYKSLSYLPAAECV